MSEIVEEDGKQWNIRYTKTGTRIRSEIPPAHTHPKVDTAQMALMKKIADSLGVQY